MLRGISMDAKRYDPGLLALAALPLVLLALDSDWIFSGPHRDAWIYYGYFENGVAYLRGFPELYYGSRPAMIVPGWLLHHLLPSVPANVLLHLAVFWSAVLSFYLVARDLFGPRVALLAGLALGCHPYFLQAAGWNYVDGFGIAYFLTALLFLTRATASSSWRVLLLGAGAMATAIVSTNVFYAVYLPVLAGQFLLLNRQRGRIPLLHAMAWVGAGAAAMLALFGGLLLAAGGEFFYLTSSLEFLLGSVGTANPFRQSTYAWVAHAVWLVFPAAVLAGGLAGLGALRRDRAALWCQIQLAYLAFVVVYFQVFGDTGVLQHFFYSSLVLPAAFLAFAGQLGPLVERLPPRGFGALAAAVAAFQILPLLVPRTPLFSAPAVLALLAALASIAFARWRTGGARAVIACFFFLAVSQLLVRQGGGIFWQFETYGGDGRGLYSQMDRAMHALEAFDSSRQLRLWYDDGAQDGIVYDALASAFLLCPRMVNFDFPVIENPRMCDGVHLVPGMQVAVLSSDPSAFEKAAASLRAIGLVASRLKREEIPGPARGFAITYLRCESWVAAP